MNLSLKPVNKYAKIAIVCSRFNEPVTSKLLDGALAELKKTMNEDDILVVKVPGAVEIPLVAKKIAQQKKYGAIIALGAVIRGETTHYDYVCGQVSQGCQKVMLDYDIPIIFGVLTTENSEQALDRVGGNHGDKGIESAQAALEMITIIDALNH